MKRIEFNPKLLARPDRYEPDWFKISSSMGDTYSACRELVVWQYIHKIKQEKMNNAMLRRSAVIFATREDLIRKFPDATIYERVLYFLKSEAKSIIDQTDGAEWTKWETNCNDTDIDESGASILLPVR